MNMNDELDDRDQESPEEFSPETDEDGKKKSSTRASTRTSSEEAV